MFELTQEELKERLRRADSEEEKQALMQEYSQKMAKAQDDIEQQKQKKLRDVRKLLKEERLRRKKELYKYVVQQRIYKCFYLQRKTLTILLNNFFLNSPTLEFHTQT